jgi:putative spermidine/putrescine transport system permease protein
VATATRQLEQGASSTRPAPRFRRPIGWAWLGLVPFFLFSIAFLFLPALYLIVGSFRNNQDELTLQNYADLSTGIIPGAFLTTIEVSLVTAVVGGLFGLLLAYAVILGGLPRVLRVSLVTFAGVASNFAGVPLALAFTFTLGQLGFLTVLLRDLGFDIYGTGFRLTSKVGVELVYLYFQFPLMVLIIAPALEGLKREWREAAENMGATPAQYWRHVALPILTPSILGAMILLFGNAFGAQATAFQLTGGTLNLVPIVIGAQIRGDVLHNPGLGYAMAMGMVAIMAGSIFLYSILQRRSERWLRS